MIDLPKNKKIILFDGICNLCNNTVLRIIKYDKKNTFIFTSLQSKVGQEILEKIKVDTSKIDSIILYVPTVSYDIKSTASLKIMQNFGGFWKLTNVFWIVPEKLRNLVYDYIAKNRYKWFGKKESCIIPRPELKAKFLEE